uniref:HEAT repeat domain-containing protein n=1 Tax=Streptomyces sp. NBC_00008 TaxID=2903610 RepID=A0AAU2VMF0_9ACTN
MDGYQGLTAMIESAWEELNGSEAGRRDLSLDVVGDILETGRLTPGDAERAVERLVAVALSDESYPVQESALHAVFTASTHYELPYRVVEPLAFGADAFEPVLLEPVLLEYVLGVLGSTHDHALLPVVERFLQHPHPEVRREAAEAVNEVRWSRETAQGGTAQSRPA